MVEQFLNQTVRTNDNGLSQLRKERLAEMEAVIAGVMDASDPDLKSDLTAEQIVMVVRAKAFAIMYNCDVMSKVVEYLLRARYSHKRLSRGELTKALQTIIANEETSEAIRRKTLLGA